MLLFLFSRHRNLYFASGNTNASKFEVYALLGEVYGSGCPLGYLLIQSKSGEPGGKERYISELLDYFNKKWKLKALITLTDKDISEINAFLKVFPDAKHQLCFWHCLRAIKTRLSILRRKPKYYDVKEAKMEFPWIDEKFLPLAQRNMKESDKMSEVWILFLRRWYPANADSNLTCFTTTTTRSPMLPKILFRA